MSPKHFPGIIGESPENTRENIFDGNPIVNSYDTSVRKFPKKKLLDSEKLLVWKDF